MRRRLIGPLVEAWFDLLPANQQTNARALHAMILAIQPDLTLFVRSGHLVYGLERLHILALAPHRLHLHLQLFAGASMTAQFPMLEGTGPVLRQLRIRHGQAFDTALVKGLVEAALRRAGALLPAAPAGDEPA